jgi:hypothetical protein
MWLLILIYAAPDICTHCVSNVRFTSLSYIKGEKIYGAFNKHMNKIINKTDLLLHLIKQFISQFMMTK